MNVKNNRGLVGTDVSIAIIILILFVAIITTIFYQIGMSNLKTTRNAIATDLAVKLTENIKLMTYDEFLKTDFDEEWFHNSEINIPDGYNVTIEKDDDNLDKQELMQEVYITVSYKIQDEQKNISIKTLKIHE